MTERKRLKLPPEIMDEIKKHDRYPAHANELIKERLKDYYEERLVELKRATRKPVSIGRAKLLGKEVVITGFTFMENHKEDEHGELLDPVVKLDRVCFSFMSPNGLVNCKIPANLVDTMEFAPVGSNALTIEEYHEDLAKTYGWKTD